MKVRLTPHRLVRQALLAVWVVAGISVGCTGAAPDRMAYRSINLAVSAAEGAIDVFNAGYMAGKYDNAAYDKVAKAIKEFQAVATLASRMNEGLAAGDPLVTINNGVRDLFAVIEAFTGPLKR